MKIAFIGSTGQIGRHIAAEALLRGHQITALVRSTAQIPKELNAMTIRIVNNIRDTAHLSDLVAGHDLIVSALGLVQADHDASILADTTHAIIAAARTAHVARIMVVGGAGCLYLAPQQRFFDSPLFPHQFKPFALGQLEAVDIFRDAGDLDWLIFVPAAEIGPGAQRGRYRVGANTLIFDQAGLSCITYPDFASAFVDEIEQHRFMHTLATTAY